MRRKFKFYSFDPFTDLLFNILFGFVFLFFLTIFFINPITKLGNVNLKAEYIFPIEWKESLPDDVESGLKIPTARLSLF
ncbi:MAG: hypothetical protein Ct9H90mP18_01050 [Gammaproteobacteria bacterium]|nr:MAG: hypothetical protein Ct9H90mP18_01050 [Gammaproteobacteria bacterium]